jgi:hypothetical protein
MSSSAEGRDQSVRCSGLSVGGANGFVQNRRIENGPGAAALRGGYYPKSGYDAALRYVK